MVSGFHGLTRPGQDQPASESAAPACSAILSKLSSSRGLTPKS